MPILDLHLQRCVCRPSPPSAPLPFPSPPSTAALKAVAAWWSEKVVDIPLTVVTQLSSNRLAQVINCTQVHEVQLSISEYSYCVKGLKRLSMGLFTT